MAGAHVTLAQAELKMGLGGLQTWIRTCFGLQPPPQQVCKTFLVEMVSWDESPRLEALGNPVPQGNGPASCQWVVSVRGWIMMQ